MRCNRCGRTAAETDKFCAECGMFLRDAWVDSRLLLAMVHERERMTFTSVSLTERSDIELVTLLAEIQQPNRRGE